MLNTQSRGPHVSSGASESEQSFADAAAVQSSPPPPIDLYRVRDEELSYSAMRRTPEPLTVAHRFDCYRLNCGLSRDTVDVTIDRDRSPLPTDQVLVSDGAEVVQLMYSEFCRKRLAVERPWVFMGVVCRWSIAL